MPFHVQQHNNQLFKKWGKKWDGFSIQKIQRLDLNYLTFSTLRCFPMHVIQPPIQKFGVEGRYAHALYSAAAKTDALAKVEKEINTLTKLIATDGGLDTFLKVRTWKMPVCSISCFFYFLLKQPPLCNLLICCFVFGLWIKYPFIFFFKKKPFILWNGNANTNVVNFNN